VSLFVFCQSIAYTQLLGKINALMYDLFGKNSVLGYCERKRLVSVPKKCKTG
jgi:hypothetical protein